MTAKVPAVSVALAAYNHERYVEKAIRSLLDQTFTDLEVVVVDDGSTDETAQVIASFHDPRVISIRQENQGPGAAGNRAIAACRGKYLALMSGDDVCYPERIQRQLEAYQQGKPGVIFGPVTFIDEEGNNKPDGGYLEGVFDVTPRMREEIFHRFFFRGNFLNAVTAFTERSLLGNAPFDPLLFQLQDFDLWVRLVKSHDIRFVQEPLVQYRIRSDHQNLSSPKPEHDIRCTNEHLFIMRRFFDGAPTSLIREAFRGELRCPDFGAAERVCEEAFLFLRAPHPMQWVIGMEKLYGLLSVPETEALLKERYQFSYLDYVNLLKRFDVMYRWPPTVTSLFVDTGNGFNAAEVCQQPVSSGLSQFRITFDLQQFTSIRGLRWDPVELQHCQLELKEIVWQERTGDRNKLPLTAISSNGREEGAGKHCFETHDPMIFLPIQGEIASLTLSGKWMIKDVYSTCARTARLYDESQVQCRHLLRELEWEMRTRDQYISNLNGEIWKRDRYISQLGEDVGHRDQRIAHLEQQIAAVSAHGQGILNLRNWRWLMPMRRAVSKLRRRLASSRKAG